MGDSEENCPACGGPRCLCCRTRGKSLGVKEKGKCAPNRRAGTRFCLQSLRTCPPQIRILFRASSGAHFPQEEGPGQTLLVSLCRPFAVRKAGGGRVGQGSDPSAVTPELPDGRPLRDVFLGPHRRREPTSPGSPKAVRRGEGRGRPRFFLFFLNKNTDVLGCTEQELRAGNGCGSTWRPDAPSQDGLRPLGGHGAARGLSRALGRPGQLGVGLGARATPEAPQTPRAAQGVRPGT